MSINSQYMENFNPTDFFNHLIQIASIEISLEISSERERWRGSRVKSQAGQILGMVLLTLRLPGEKNLLCEVIHSLYISTPSPPNKEQSAVCLNSLQLDEKCPRSIVLCFNFYLSPKIQEAIFSVLSAM